MTDTILVIDDEADIRDVLGDILEDEGYGVLKAAHSEQAISLIKANDVSLIILDIWLENSDMDGVEILKTLKSTQSRFKHIPILMISGHGNVEVAVNAMKIGAYDFIEKPFKVDHMLMTVSRALQQFHLQRENTKLRDNAGIKTEKITAKSASMATLYKRLEDNKDSLARVVILGEIGTGKSRFARQIHDMSPYKNGNYHSFKASQLTDKDIESLFTDQQYAKSTVLIEKIDGLTPQAQTCLLKHLSQTQDQTHIPRIIVTAPSEWETCPPHGKFSNALYDRLNIFQYLLPPLSERFDEFADLIHEFAHAMCQDMNCDHHVTFTTDAIILLQDQPWKGHIRQLKCTVEWLTLSHLLENNISKPITSKEIKRYFLQSDHVDISVSDNVSLGYVDQQVVQPVTSTSPHFSHDEASLTELYDAPLREAREQFERDYLSALLKRFRGNISQMANHVEMERTALHRKLKTMNIRYEDLNGSTAQIKERAMG